MAVKVEERVRIFSAGSWRVTAYDAREGPAARIERGDTREALTILAADARDLRDILSAWLADVETS